MLIVQDQEKKYFLDDGILVVQDLLDPEDIVTIKDDDFSDHERSTYKYLKENEGKI